MATIRVLHVDDDPDFVALSARATERERERISVTTERSAAAALDRLGGAGVDCIVSDLEMPGLDGLEFLDAVREEFPARPFILFTGRGDADVAARAYARGATGYLHKRGGLGQFERLADHIERAVAERGAGRQWAGP